MHWDHGWGWGFGLGWVFMILFWIVIIAGVVAAVRWLFVESRAKDKTALDILNDRYARGEIDKDEYERKRRDITTII